tara:strand:+ start:3171 stop:3614 length:444 start_codon:yes stop_codon:yes gene_type:complete
MALLANRKGIGGRKPTVLTNPFIVTDEWGDLSNILWEMEDELDIRIEDTLIGCVSAFNADKPPSVNQQFVNWYKLVKVYCNCDILTRQSIQDYLMCSESQAKRYVRVIKLANPFILRIMQGKSGSNVKGYVHVSLNQVKAGYLTIIK